MDAGPGRVLVCTQGFPRHPDDHHAPFVLDHARALAAAGAAVTVLCPSAPGLARRERFGPIEVVRFRYAPRRFETLAYGGAMHRAARGPRALLVPLLLAGFLVGALREGRRADVVHAHWWAPSGLVAVAAGRLLGVATVVHLHGTDAAIARGPLRPLARAVLRRAGAVLAASRALAAWAGDVAGVAATVAPMPLGRDRVPPPSPPPAGGPVLAVGRLVPEKGFDVLVRAAAAAGTPVTLVGDGGERAALEALAAEVGAAVTFVGAVAPGELAARYGAARVVAVPSRREGFGLVAAEAAAAGRAVVASAVGGLPDVVRDGVTGVLVPPGDVPALARALRDVDPALGAAGPEAVAGLAPAAVAAANLAAHERARAAVRPPLGPRLARWGGGTVAVLAVALAVAAVAREWDEARRLSLRWEPGPLAAAVACVAGANLAMAGAWGWLVRRLGGRLPWGPAMRVWWLGQLGRHLPTGLGSVPARVVLGGRQGVDRRLLVAATGGEVVAVLLACAATAGLLLPGPLAAAAVPAGLAVGAAAFAAGLARALPGDPAGGARAFLRPAAAYLGVQEAQVLLRGAGLWAVLHLAGPDAQPALVEVAGAVGLAYLVGFLAVFAPGGVGVREAVLAAVLGPTAGPAAAAAAAVLWRLLELAVELAILAWARGLGVRGDAGGSPHRGLPV